MLSTPQEVMRRLTARGLRLRASDPDAVANSDSSSVSVSDPESSSNSNSKTLSRLDEDPLPAASAVHTPPPEAGRVFSAEERRQDEETQRRARKEAFEEQELTIRRHRKSFFTCGDAFARIARERFYSDHLFDSFEDYVEARQKWIKPRQAWNYIRAADVARRVKAVEHQLSLSAAIALSRLKPVERQAECLSLLVAEYGKSPTAKQVRETVDRMLGKSKIENRKSKIRPVRYRATHWTITALPKAGADPRELTEILREWLRQLEQQCEPPRVGELV